MKRKYVDLEISGARSITKDGNVDYRYWFDKTLNERVQAAGIMTSVAFREPDYFKKKVDRNIYSSRKHPL